VAGLKRFLLFAVDDEDRDCCWGWAAFISDHDTREDAELEGQFHVDRRGQTAWHVVDTTTREVVVSSGPC
jgi:hypothetical protein